MGDIVQGKKRLFIIGAGGLGRELESWLTQSPGFGVKFDIVGFLDDNPKALDDNPSDYRVIGTPLKYNYGSADFVIFGIADPVIKIKLYENLINVIKLFTFIAPNTIIGKNNKIGEGSVICPNCIITTNVKIGKCVFINCGSQIGHDSDIGSFSSIMSNVDIGGKCKIGSGVFIGSHVNIIPTVNIENSAKIGAGSTVIKRVKEKSSVFGNPAKRVF